MYKVYKTSRGKLSNPATPIVSSWIDINAPTEEEMNELRAYFDIPEEVLTSVKDIEEVPKLEDVTNFKFILVQTPYDIEGEHQEYAVRPLGIIYNQDYVITITNGNNEVINYLKNKLRNYHNNKIIDTSKPHQLILKLMLFTSKIYLRYLKTINHTIHQAQDEMGKTLSNKDIINLMDVEKSLTYFSRSLHSNHLVMEKLSKRKTFTSTEQDEELTQDVIDENKQALETCKIYEHIVTNTAATFATIISNNLNRTVKFLTALTIILMIPTLVVSAYGMNVKLPLQDSQYAFDYVLIISGLFALMGIAWFYRKNLF